MKLHKIFDLFETYAIIKSAHYYSRYKKLITTYAKIGLKKSKQSLGELEVHHILPRKMYPEHGYSYWNLISLPVKAHYIAHYLLFKSIQDNSCVYAFNQMRRVTANKKPNCRLYAAVRIEFAKIISKNNRGRINTAEHTKSISRANKSKNTYRGPDGGLKRYVIGTEPDGWLPFQTGRVRTNGSKDVISAIMQDRKWQYNLLTREVKFEKENLPGFESGFPPWFLAAGKLTANTSWVHNTITGKNKRLKQTEPMPAGYKFGRIFDNKGFDKINNRGLVKVFDLCSKLFCMVDASEVVNPKFITPGTSVDNIWLYCYNNIVYTSRNALFENNKHLPQTNGGPLLPSAKVPGCHWNQTPARNQFSQENAGKTYAEIGIAVISAKDYNFNEKEIYVRRR